MFNMLTSQMRLILKLIDSYQKTPLMEKRIPDSNYIWLITFTSLIFTIQMILFGAHSSHYHMFLIANLVSLSFALSIHVLKKYLHSLGASLLIVFGTLFLFGLYLQSLAPFFFYLAITLLLIFFLKSLLINKLKDISQLQMLLIGGITLSLILIQRSEFGYAQPFMHINVHKDSLFHISITSMIKNYGVASTGLHGLVPIYYHTASHAMMAAISLLSGLSVFDCYAYIYPIVWIPILLVVTLELSHEILPVTSTKESLFRIALLTVLLMGVRHPVFAKALFFPNYALSESYTISLILMLAVISVLFAYEKSINSLKVNFLSSLTIIALFVLTTYSKVSAGLLCLCILAGWSVLGRAAKRSLRMATTILCTLLFVFLLKIVNKSASQFELSFLSQIREVNISFLPEGATLLAIKILYFFLFHLFFSTVFFIGAWKYIFKEKYYTVFTPWLLLGLLATILVGIAPGLIMELPSGTGFYFSNPSQILAIPLILIFFSIAFKDLFTGNKSLFDLYNWVKDNYSFSITCLIVYFVFCFTPTLYTEFRAIKILSRGMRQPKDFPYQKKYIEALHKISQDSNTRNLLVYIPKDEVAFWSNEKCDKAGFLIPAFSERSTLLSLPNTNCTVNNYGYKDYAPELYKLAQDPQTDESLLTLSKKLGFHGVIIVRENGIKTIRTAP